MIDNRPAECRFRLQDEGKPYPRSFCRACGRSIFRGLGNHCRLADLTPSPEVVKELVEALRWISNNPSAHRTNMVKVADDALAKLGDVE